MCGEAAPFDRRPSTALRLLSSPNICTFAHAHRAAGRSVHTICRKEGKEATPRRQWGVFVVDPLSPSMVCNQHSPASISPSGRPTVYPTTALYSLDLFLYVDELRGNELRVEISWRAREACLPALKTAALVRIMKRGSGNRFAMNFRKAGSQEAYAPGSSSSSVSPGAMAGPPGETAAPPAKKKSRFAAAATQAAAATAAAGAEGSAAQSAATAPADPQGR